MPYATAIEYSKILMGQKKWDAADVFWKTAKNLKPEDPKLLATTAEIFKGNIKSAYLLNLKTDPNPLADGYSGILNNPLKTKSPGLAALMSAIVPGTGKVYSKNWKDGLIALIFTSGMAFQSVRNFNKHGISNYRGWIYGGLGFGFYLGNIYGSAKSAKDYNLKKINKIQHEASDLFNSYY